MRYGCCNYTKLKWQEQNKWEKSEENSGDFDELTRMKPWQREVQRMEIGMTKMNGEFSCKEENYQM